MIRLLILIIFISLSNLVQGQSCSTPAFTHYSFEDVKEVLIKNECQSCHTPSKNRWHFEDYDAVFESGVCDPNVVVRGDAGSSHFIKLLQGIDECDGADRAQHILSSEDFKLIEAWINVGAPERCIPTAEELQMTFEEEGCISCHNRRHDLDLTNFNFLSQSSNVPCLTNQIVKLYEPEESSLWQAVVPDNNCLPDHHKLDHTKARIIRDWISAGAPVSSSSLPLELLSFKISTKDQSPYLEWRTASEIGVQQMDIERRTTRGDFEVIGTRYPKGDQMNQYDYQDQSTTYGIHYYRINIIDYDGRHEYSPLQRIDLKATDFIFNAYPNPTINNQTIMLEWYSKQNIQESAKMKLMNSSGAVLQTYKIKAGYNTFSLPDLMQGIYYLTVEDYYGGSHYERLMIIKK